MTKSGPLSEKHARKYSVLRRSNQIGGWNILPKLEILRRIYKNK